MKNNINNIRQQHKITQKQVAKHLDISQSLVVYYEKLNLTNNILAKYLLFLSQKTRTPIDDIITTTKPTKPTKNPKQ